MARQVRSLIVMPYVAIDDLNDKRLDVYRDLPRRNLTRASGRFIAEGRLLVERLLASSLATESVLCSEHHCERLPSGIDPLIPIYVVPHPLLRAIIGFDFHRGVLACGLRPANLELSQWIDRSDDRGRDEDRLLVVCPHVLDPTNLAGVVRNSSAFGADGLLLGPQCADVYSRRVVRVSMGTLFQLPVRIVDDLTADLHWLGQHGFHRVATVLDPAATVLPHASRHRRLALLFGSEGHGLDERWIAQCDEKVTLPMQLNTDSLNLATASGIFLYHYTQVAK